MLFNYRKCNAIIIWSVNGGIEELIAMTWHKLGGTEIYLRRETKTINGTLRSFAYQKELKKSWKFSIICLLLLMD